jgi:hypothetical protein
VLQGISGTRPTACVAVGAAQSTTFGSTAVAEHWQSGTWRVLGIPDPIRMLANDLDGVSCAGPATCLAVGSELGSGPVAERRDGTRWHNLPVPSNVPEMFTAVSCAASSCTAFGSINNAQDPYPRPLAVRWSSS